MVAIDSRIGDIMPQDSEHIKHGYFMKLGDIELSLPASEESFLPAREELSLPTREEVSLPAREDQTNNELDVSTVQARVIIRFEKGNK